MHLADIGFLDYEHIQLLADSLQPVLVLELTPIAKALIQHGLLTSCCAFCQHRNRICFVLSTTSSGRAYVAQSRDDFESSRLSENLNPTAKVARRARILICGVKAGAKLDQRGGIKVDRRNLGKESNGQRNGRAL